MNHKTFPPGTFIPTRQRLLTIIQLCFAFSLALWYMAQPFMGEYFNIKSRMLMYEYVMGTSTILQQEIHKEKLAQNRELFSSLPIHEREAMTQDYQTLYEYATRSLFTKMKDGLKILLIGIPAFKLAWILFAIIISVLILKQKEGAQFAAWLLPLIAFAYGIDNQINGHTTVLSPDQALIPQESQLIEYLNEPLKASPSELREQLKEAWEKYLITNWGQPNHASTSKYPLLTLAEFNFTKAQITALHSVNPRPSIFTFHEKSNPFWLYLYCIWNLFFAWQMNKSQKFNFFKEYRRVFSNFKIASK